MRVTHLFQRVILPLILLVSVDIQAQTPSFVMTPIGPNNFLDKPWDLNYGPDDYLWVTERQAGIVVRVNPATAARDELIQISDLSSTAGQDGLLGMAFHDELLADSPFVYLSYTYLVQGERRQKLVRYTYSITGEDGSLSSPMTILDSLPSSNDHNSGRLVFGPDAKLYYTIGDQGGNQNANYCNPILSQVLPSQQEIDQQDWSNYPGKVLRLNTDGSIPVDNPMLEGVQSHIYSYGHRNAQGIVFNNNGILYSDEHGPNTDDEVNIIYAGNNYGWPRVVGFQDDQAYDYCNWSSVSNCESLNYSNGSCPATATFLEESTFMATNYQEPLFSMFAVSDDYDYNNPACENTWICRPNVAPSSIGIYQSDAIPSWDNSLLVTSLKRGRIYRFKLNEDGTAVLGDTTQHFYTQNRYRDIVVSPDGQSFYILTGQTGRTSGPSGLSVTSTLVNPGNILKFTLQESVSITNEGPESVFKIWPNPVSNSLFIELEQYGDRNVRAELINITGQVVKEFTEIKSGVNEMKVDNFPAGLYTFRLYTKDHTWQKQVVLY